MRRITASAIEDLYMCPARATFAERPEDPDADTSARDWGNRAHAWWETGDPALAAEFAGLSRPTEYVREIQVWYDIRTGRGGCRLPPAPRYYDDLPPWYLVGTADAARRDGDTLEVWDLKTGRPDPRTGKHRPKNAPHGNRQLLTLAMGLVYLSKPALRPRRIVLGIVNAVRGEAPIQCSTDSWEFDASELDAHFARYVYNPVAKVRSAELHVLGGGAHSDWTNPGTQCYLCRADGCTSRQEKKEKEKKR